MSSKANKLLLLMLQYFDILLSFLHFLEVDASEGISEQAAHLQRVQYQLLVVCYRVLLYLSGTTCAVIG